MPPTQDIDFNEVVSTLSQPLAVCDAEGVVRWANAAALRALGVSKIGGVRLELDQRETFSAMQVRPGAGVMEFFMADVPLVGGGHELVSVSVAPLDFGGFRVTFIEDSQTKGSPSVRLLRALSAVTEHAAIFDDPRELLTLFGSCLVEVFPDYAWRFELHSSEGLLGAHEHPFTQNPSRREGRDQITCEGGAPIRTELLWALGKSGLAVWTRATPKLRAGLQIESERGRGLSEAEAEALEIFMNFFGFICQRYLTNHGPRLELLGPILEQLEAAVALCDRRRGVRSCNAAFARLVGCAAEEVAGEDVIAFFDAELQGTLRSAAAAAMSGAIPEPLTLAIGAAGQTVTLRITPLDDGDRGARDGVEASSGFWLIAQPSAASLRALEDEFARAEQLMQIGELASGVAHELKNPLTSILNYADYLLQKYRDQLFEKRDSERLVRIIEGVERMDHFIRDLVLLARPHGEDVPPERLNVHAIMRRARLLCDVAIEQHRVRVSEEFSATRAEVLGVEGQLVQVFVNLFTNAAGAMPEEGGVLRLKTSVRGEELCCEVEDTGCGMDEATSARVFEPFYTTRKSTGGSGLGLPLVRALVERHGGSVEFESEPGEGTIFRVILPLLPSD